MINTDLFPETLLVSHIDGRLMTTSLRVAEHFGKQHKNVIRDIEKLIKDCPDSEFSQLNFEPRNYVYYTGKNQERVAVLYEITRNGFAILAMGFTGAKALRWKIDFLTAFDEMDAVLQRTLKREATVLYRLKPHWQTIQQGKSQGFTHRQVCELTGHRAPATIGGNLKRMRQLGLLE